MQWPELLALASLAAAALCLVLPGWRGYAQSSTWLAALLLLVDLNYRGLALQLVPLIPAWVLLGLRIPSRDQPAQPASVRPLSGYLALSLVSTSLGLLILLPFFTLPRPTGPYQVGTRTQSFTDETRSLDGSPRTPNSAPRELVVQLWYPIDEHQGASLARYVRAAEVSPLKSYLAGIRTNSWQDAAIARTGAPFPVLLYGHGWGSRRTIDTFLAEDLASHGFVVVAIDHPLNSARIRLSDGSILKATLGGGLNPFGKDGPSGVEALWNDELTHWTADQSFVLDQLQHSDLAARLDPTRIGAFGHSFGGAASFAMLGRDPRVKAAVNLDGWNFAALDRRTTQPILQVYEAAPPPDPAHPEPGPEGILDRADTAAVDASLQHFGGVEAFVQGTQHLDFTDQTLLSPFQRITHTGPIRGERIRQITRQLVLSFFHQTLRGQGQLPSFPEVKLRRFPVNP
jgi:predicted dienelactone hydrolase